MVCGGEVEVYFTYFAPGALPDLSVGGFLLLGADGTAQVSATGAPGLHQECFTLPLKRRGTVYLFGGGHVAKALCEALSRVAFPVVVLEDRPEFLTPDRFPDAKDRRLVDFSDLSGLTLSKEDLVVVMTRGHQSDFAVLRQVLPTTPPGTSGAWEAAPRWPSPASGFWTPGFPLPGWTASKAPSAFPSAPRRRRKSPCPSPPSSSPTGRDFDDFPPVFENLPNCFTKFAATAIITMEITRRFAAPQSRKGWKHHVQKSYARRS